MSLPFTEKSLSTNIVLREFSRDVDSEELVWHQDREDREVKVMAGKDWLLQLDNELPTPMIEGEVYNIPALHFHRIIKGSSRLVVEIYKKTIVD